MRRSQYHGRRLAEVCGKWSCEGRRGFTSAIAAKKKEAAVGIDNSPVGDDPVDDESLEIVVADRAAAAVIFLEPVEDGLG